MERWYFFILTQERPAASNVHQMVISVMNTSVQLHMMMAARALGQYVRLSFNQQCFSLLDALKFATGFGLKLTNKDLFGLIDGRFHVVIGQPNRAQYQP